MTDKTAEINFPLVNISIKKWSDDDITTYFEYDRYYRSFNYFHFKSRILNNTFCDCNGNLFKVIDLIPPKSNWRRVFFLIPGVYKQEMVFENLNEQIHLEELREHMIDRVSQFYDKNKLFVTYQWIQQLKLAQSYEELIDCQVEE
jgi:hypothetical protein